MKPSGMKLKAPVVGSCGTTQLLMPDGAVVPMVKSVRMVYEPNELPVCVVELYGVEVVHPEGAV